MQTLLLAIMMGICCGVIGSVYRFILAYETILNWWFRFGSRYERKWFYRPIWGCAKCFAGQLSFWSWLLIVIIPLIVRHYRQNGGLFNFSTNTTQTAGLAILGLLTAISSAITTAVILGPILEAKNEK